MARLARTTLGTGLWLIRVLTVLCAVTVVGLLVWSASVQPPRLKKSAAYPEAKAPIVQPEPVAEEPATPVPEMELELPAHPTKFVRRLAAQRPLERLHDAARKGADLEQLMERYRQLEPCLLQADGPYTRARTRQGLIERTRALRIGRLDRDTARAGELLVRVWTRDSWDGGDEFDRVQAMINHVMDTAGGRLPQGFDVLMTAQLGQDVFPRQWKPPYPVSGLYFLADQYCVVKRDQRPAWREEVIKHELIHAYCRQFADGFVSSRFVSEGLAEYLRCCAPTDDGFAAPRHVYADNLARLGSMLMWMPGTPKLSVLVKLEPSQLYALGSFGYLMAQAALAFLDPKIIEQAFREKSDGAIVAAIQGIDGEEFLRFVRKGGEGGAPERAFTVEDTVPDKPMSPKLRSTAWKQVLKGMGLKTGRRQTERSLTVDPAAMVTDPEQVAKLLEEVLAERSNRILVTDTSDAMDRPIELAPLPDSLTRYGIAASTPREFVLRLYQILYQEQPVDVYALSGKSTAGRLEVLEAEKPYDLAGLAYARPVRNNLVVCIASGTKRMKTWERLYRIYRKVPPPPKVLVVDLSDGKGDAVQLARFYLTLPEGNTQVAYWDPLKRKERKR